MAKRPRATRPHMPGFGLSEDTGGLRPFSWAEELLRDAHSYWIATARADGRPHLMPVWAVWHAGALWFSTGGSSRKARNLDGRPECSVGLETGGDSVIVEGTAQALKAREAPREIAALYNEKYGMGYPPDSLLFRVAPRTAFGFSETGEFAETATRWTFED